MFREMRRTRQLLDGAESMRILEEGTSGVLALLGDGEYPYAVPISYVCEGDKIYFHGAKSGHKIDAIKRHPKASFCVIGQDSVVPQKYTTRYASVIAFGKIRILEDEKEGIRAARLLAKKYHPLGTQKEWMQEIQKEWKALCMMELCVEHMTGKEGMELVEERERGRMGQ